MQYATTTLCTELRTALTNSSNLAVVLQDDNFNTDVYGNGAENDAFASAHIFVL